MSVTKDITTTVGKVRYLIGDTDITAANFTDEELQGFLDLNFASVLLASAMALEALAANAALNLTDIQLGTLQIDETSKVEMLQKQAARFRELEQSTPAFAIAEENLSGFNELDIIRNYILRTQG